MAKTKRESDKRRKMADFMVLPRPAKSVQNGAGFSGKTGPAKKERVASVPQESSWQELRSRPCQKEKEQRRLSRVPDHEGGES